jgi:hypothetical protein
MRTGHWPHCAVGSDARPYDEVASTPNGTGESVRGAVNSAADRLTCHSTVSQHDIAAVGDLP